MLAVSEDSTNMSNNPPQPVQDALAILEARVPHLLAVLVFGSFAKGRVRSDSDLDLAFLPKEPLDMKILWELNSDLSIAAGREVNLIDLSNPKVSSVLKFEVIKGGKLIYCPDRSMILDMKCRFIEQFHDLCIARTEIDLKQRERLKLDAAA
jgi:uncharacterized protein